MGLIKNLCLFSTSFQLFISQGYVKLIVQFDNLPSCASYLSVVKKLVSRKPSVTNAGRGILLFTQMLLLTPKIKVHNAPTHVNSRGVS